jgi:hypothetical protein
MIQTCSKSSHRVYTWYLRAATWTHGPKERRPSFTCHCRRPPRLMSPLSERVATLKQRCSRAFFIDRTSPAALLESWPLATIACLMVKDGGNPFLYASVASCMSPLLNASDGLAIVIRTLLPTTATQELGGACLEHGNFQTIIYSIRESLYCLT